VPGALLGDPELPQRHHAPERPLQRDRSIPTAEAVNSAANGAFFPRSQATSASTTAMPSTTRG
jgi:hypothetical protein